MSTKSTVAHGHNFHLYIELMDNELHLEVDGTEFRAVKMTDHGDYIDIVLSGDVLKILSDDLRKKAERTKLREY